ncbi:hypothetical protein KCP73_12830 [Salmonella enterica subsp. enterica]|nr:hypothetical protein KCP73_12830 [Salmonella enterica subsp. enterica]
MQAVWLNEVVMLRAGITLTTARCHQSHRLGGGGRIVKWVEQSGAVCWHRKAPLTKRLPRATAA